MPNRRVPMAVMAALSCSVSQLALLSPVTANAAEADAPAGGHVKYILAQSNANTLAIRDRHAGVRCARESRKSLVVVDRDSFVDAGQEGAVGGARFLLATPADAEDAVRECKQRLRLCGIS